MSSYETTSSDDSSSEESSSSGSEDEEEDNDKMVNVRERRKEEFRNNEAVDEDRDTEDLGQDTRQRQVLPVNLQCCTLFDCRPIQESLALEREFKAFWMLCLHKKKEESRQFGDTNET